MIYSFIRRWIRQAQRPFLDTPGGLAILAYHLVGAGTHLRVDIGQDVFRNHVTSMKALGDVVPPDQAPALPGGKKNSDRIRIALTFDDAYENFYATVWPILCEFSISVLLFVPVGFIDKQSAPPISGTQHLAPASWRQLREMSDHGLVRMGSHGWSHRDMRKMGEAEMTDDLTRSRHMMEDKLGVDVPSFCYPQGLWSRRTEKIVGKAYETAFVAGGRKITPVNLNPLRLWRTPVTRDMGNDIEAVIHSRVWAEEWAADIWRRHFR